MIEDSDSDIICLQEVTSQFMEVLLKSTFVRKNYKISLSHFFTFYGLVILTRLNGSFYELKLES